jgi:ubiquinone/menaquinone biosynthesis C-methylase UbiE
MDRTPAQEWGIRLFQKSVLKQRKLKEVTGLLGSTAGLHCLDIGSDNGVISYLLRQRGGSWKSADLDAGAVRAISSMIGEEVYQLDGGPTPFTDDEFDCIAIVDFLEHIPDDAGFIQEMYRILKPGGKLIVNVPHQKESLLRKFRHQIGQTDEKHGHLRPGYNLDSLKEVLGEFFTIERSVTYSKFFSELIDTLIVFGVSLLQRRKRTSSSKGLLVTQDDLQTNRSMFKVYALIYPVIWLFSRLDNLLFFTSGYMLIAQARVSKVPQVKGKNGFYKEQIAYLKNQ